MLSTHMSQIGKSHEGYGQTAEYTEMKEKEAREIDVLQLHLAHSVSQASFIILVGYHIYNISHVINCSFLK